MRGILVVFSGRLEKTTRTSCITWLGTIQQDLRQHNLTPYTTSGYGSELPSVDDDVDVWCYTILSCVPEMRIPHPHTQVHMP